MFFTLVRGVGILLWGLLFTTKAEIAVMELKWGLHDLNVTLKSPNARLQGQRDR